MNALMENKCRLHSVIYISEKVGNNLGQLK